MLDLDSALFVWFIIDLDLVFLNQLFELFAELEQKIFDAGVFSVVITKIGMFLLEVQ